MIIGARQKSVSSLQRMQSIKEMNIEPKMAALDEFSKAESEELTHWKGRLRFDMGALTTPPAGELAPKMAKAQDYLVAILNKLALDDLTESGIELRLELFSGDVPQAALDDKMDREVLWGQKHEADEPWPIRQWMGVPDDSHKPIYRMVIDVGMLNALETEDELAFVLAHQTERLLDHLKLDPDNTEKTLSTISESFVDSRRLQSAADKAAIKRMSEAGFNPRAALKALNTLYSQTPIEYPKNDLNRALLAASHGHEAEGMRVGLVQSEVESYVRRGESTASQQMRELPPDVKISVRAQYEKPVDDIEDYKQNYRSLAEKLATDVTPDWMFGHKRRPLERDKIHRAGGDKLDREEALLAAVEHLDQLEGKTANQRVNGLVQLVLHLGSRALGHSKFSDQGLRKLHAFLAKNGKDWDAESFVAGLNRDRDDLNFEFVDKLIFDENFQLMSAGALPGLAEITPYCWAIRGGKAKPSLASMPNLIAKNHRNDHQGWPLASGIDDAIIEFIREGDLSELVTKTGSSGLSEVTELATRLFTLEQPSTDYKARVREAGNTLAEAAGESREQKARLRLGLPLENPKEIHRFLDALGDSESWKDLTPEFDQDLLVLLKVLAQVSVLQPGFIDDPGVADSYPLSLERRFVEILKRAETAEEQRNGITHLVRHMVPSKRVRSHSERRQWLGEAAELLAKDGIGDVLNQIADPDLSQHSNSISKSLTEAYGLQPDDLPDTTTRSLKALGKRVAADEFAPKREDYKSDWKHILATREYADRQYELEAALLPVASIESRTVVSKLALLGHNPELSEKFTENLERESFVTLLCGAEGALERFHITTSLYGSEKNEKVGADAGRLVLDGFLAVQDKVKSLDEWYDLADRSIEFGN